MTNPSNTQSTDLGTVGWSQFERLDAADYPAATVLVSGTDGVLRRWRSGAGQWLADVGLTKAQIAAGATSVAGLTTAGAQVDGNASPVSGAGPTLLFTDAGGIAVPVSTFDGAGISGKFGLAENILIPANTLVAGKSRIRISVTQRKVGAANCFMQVHLGSTNGTGDQAVVASQISTAGTTPVPSVMTVDLSISSNGSYGVYLHARTNVGVTTGEGSVTSGINLAVDNYINFVIAGSAAGTINSLLGYTVEVFP